MIATNTSVIIKDYELGRLKNTEKSLSVWDDQTFTSTPMGFYYDPITSEMRLIRNVSTVALSKELDEPVEYVRPEKGERALFVMKRKPKDDKQVKVINFLTSRGDYECLKKESRLLVEADTGVGKTFCAVAAANYRKIKFAILVPRTTLIDRWIEELKESANIDDSEIYIVKGSNTIDKILKAKKIKHKIFVISNDTINSYGRNKGWNKVSEFFEKINVGMKAFDEVHLKLHNNVMIDLFTNTPLTIYLTATAQRTQFEEDKLFRRIYGNIPALSVQRTQEEAKVTTHVIRYDSKPGLEDKSRIKTRRGMDIRFYIKYETKGHGKATFFRALSICVRSVIKKEGQIAILCYGIETCDIIKQFLINVIKVDEKDIGICNSKVDKKIKADQLKKRFIVTTSSSFGTGCDVSGLIGLIQCEAYSSKVTAKQVIGRLRNKGYYFELIDTGFQSRAKQFDNVKKVIGMASDTLTYHELPS